MTGPWIRSVAGVLALSLVWAFVAAQPLAADDAPEDKQPDNKAPAPPEVDETVTKAITLRKRGDAHQDARRHKQALADYREAIRLLRARNRDHQELAASLNNLATMLNALGKAHDALPLFEEALQMVRRLYSGDHPDVATSLDNLAFVLASLGKASEALPLSEEALQVRRRLHSGDHANVARSLGNLAASFAALQRMEEAKEKAEEAIQVGQRIRWPDGYRSRALLADLLLQGGNAKDALAALVPAAAQLEARRSRAASLGAEGRAQYLAVLRTADPFPLMVHAHVALGNDREALAVLERSRGREMLDLLRRGEGDPIQAARRSAQQRGDQELRARIEKASHEINEATSAVAVAEAAVKQARSRNLRKALREAKRALGRARDRYDVALRERLFAIQEALPEGRPLNAAQVQALLEEGERMLAYSLGKHSFAFVVSSDSVTAHGLRAGDDPVPLRAIANGVKAYLRARRRSPHRDPSAWTHGRVPRPRAAAHRGAPRCWRARRPASFEAGGWRAFQGPATRYARSRRCSLPRERTSR